MAADEVILSQRNVVCITNVVNGFGYLLQPSLVLAILVSVCSSVLVARLCQRAQCAVAAVCVCVCGCLGVHFSPFFPPASVYECVSVSVCACGCVGGG